MPMPFRMPMYLRRVSALMNITMNIVMEATMRPSDENTLPRRLKVAMMSLRNCGCALCIKKRFVSIAAMREECHECRHEHYADRKKDHVLKVVPAFAC